MPRPWSVLGVLLALAACGAGDGPRPVVLPEVRADDAEMQQAVATARATLADARAVLAAHGTAAALSVAIAVDRPGGGSEQVWLVGVQDDGSSMTGVVDEQPIAAGTLRPGDRVGIAADRVVDWILHVEGGMRGGYTIRVRRGRMSAGERREFDRQTGGIFSGPAVPPPARR